LHLVPPPNQPLSRDYFLRLGAVLLLLAIVWFGTNFFGGKRREQPAQSFPGRENFAQTNPTDQDKNASLFAASLPIAQNVFLIPQAEISAPIRNWDVKEPELTAQSIYAIEINSKKVLFQRDPDKKRPIASLSKLVTALVVLDKASLKDEVVVSESATQTLGEAGGLVADERISVESLLWAMLLESSNDAAAALAEKFNGQFVGFMNQKVKNLGLRNTSFSDPSGLSPENVSTAKDLTRILREIMKYPFINHILTTKETKISSTDGSREHKLINNDKLLEKYPEIIAAKTGFIDEAGECMVLAIKSSNGQDTIINVILGSQDRFADMEKLIEWERAGFIW